MAYFHFRKDGGLLVPGGSHHFRGGFQNAIGALGLHEWRFKPYCLRRGGATELYRTTADIALTCSRGRWAHVKTARIYLNDAWASLAHITVKGEHIIQRCEAACFCRIEKPVRHHLESR